MIQKKVKIFPRKVAAVAEAALMQVAGEVANGECDRSDDVQCVHSVTN